MLGRAIGKIDPAVQNVSFVVSDAKDLVFPDDTFDVVTVSFGMRNIPDTTSALREARRVLKPGGRFICLELTQPEKTWFLPVYKWYIFKVIPFLGKIFTHSSDPYSYLPVSIEAYYPPEEFKRIIEECGFSHVKAYPLSVGIATIYRGDNDG
jgi:demethylmenaquinone methyltransferase/2-methoxy-6-polyprenyl-1,4-benzoquinol methylase